MDILLKELRGLWVVEGKRAKMKEKEEVIRTSDGSIT